MRRDLLQRAAELAGNGRVFAMAVVVRREPASSTQVGNTAVITEEGEFHGWLGGSCIRPTVLREALAAIREGGPRLISLSPDPAADHRPGITTFPMTCHSGGSVDVYIEPVVPAPRLLVFGVSPAAQALVRLGKAMEYTVDVCDPEATASAFPAADRVMNALPEGAREGPGGAAAHRVFAVVATQGERDEEALSEALSAGAAYVGVIASRTRFAQIRETLVATGIDAEALGRVRNPVGLDIGARAPEEIALSILAEIVQVRRRTASGARAPVPATPVPAEPVLAAAAVPAAERDPVCGMTVSVATARHTAEHGGQTYYFCCGGCRQRFLAAPDRFLAAVPS